MPNYCVTTFFCLFFFCMFIAISKAGSKQPFLSEDPKKFCNYCQELANSKKFTNMIGKLQGTIPIKSCELVLDENANVNYTEILSKLDDFVDEVIKHTEVYFKFKRDYHQTNEYGAAMKFFKNHYPIWNVICGRKCFIFNVFAVDVLKETLQCAIGVDQSPEHIANRGKNVKLPADGIQLDGIFKAELSKIWVLIEPPNLYPKCHKLAKSSKFTTMIGILQNHKIPIDAKEVAVWGQEGTVNYHTNLLSAMESFMKEVVYKMGKVIEEDARIRRGGKVYKMKNEHEHAIIHEVPIKQELMSQEVLDKEDKLAREIAEARLFVQTHKAFVNILQEKCVEEDEPIIWNTPPTTVEYVLNDGLNCAEEVHQFRHQILAVEKGGDKKLSYSKKWSELEDEFGAAIKQIWEPKETKTGH